KGRQEQKTKNQVPNILFAEMDTAAFMRSKENPAKLDSDLWRHVKTNKNERYHFLQIISPECDAEGIGLPELTVDFRRFFSLPTDEVYLRIKTGEIKRRCRLVSPYLEHFAARFSFFSQRVALPKDHESMPEGQKN